MALCAHDQILFCSLGAIGIMVSRLPTPAKLRFRFAVPASVHLRCELVRVGSFRALTRTYVDIVTLLFSILAGAHAGVPGA